MKRVEQWQDRDLDKYGAPHPAIGMLTVRELLGWTAYHNWHHLTNVQTRLGTESSKLFEHLV